MLQEIASNIVMFLLGGVLTYFTTRWSKTLKKLECMEFGVRALIRNRMIQTVNYYREKQKPVPQWELASFDQLFEAGKGLGEDGYLDELKKVMHEDLKHETH